MADPAKEPPLPPGFVAGPPPSDLPPGFVAGPPPDSNSAGEHLKRAITDIPSEIQTSYDESLRAMKAAIPFTKEGREAWRKDIEEQQAADKHGLWSSVGQNIRNLGHIASRTAGGVAGLVSYPFAPFTGPIHSIIGHSLAAMPDESLHGTKGIGLTYEQAKEKTDLALMAQRPGMMPRGYPSPSPPGTLPGQIGSFGVTRTAGEITQDLTQLQKEQMATRGQLGRQQYWEAARPFQEQRARELERAREDVIGNVDTAAPDPLRQQVRARTPQQGGLAAQEGVQAVEAQMRNSVDNAYNRARALGGEIHAGALEGLGQPIRGELSALNPRPGQQPVVINDVTSPHASKMIDHIDNWIGRLRIQNKADPFGQPNPENITGVSLNGVDSFRKELQQMRTAAYANNETDGRAAQAIIDAFDRRIDTAVRDPNLYTGPAEARQAWLDARRLHSDYRTTFGRSFGNDPVTNKLRAILGDRQRGIEPASPTAVMDFMVGSSGVNASSTDIAVARRIRDILGENSPAWVAAKQGHLSRLVEPPGNVAEWSPRKIADRIDTFLAEGSAGNGHSIPEIFYTPAERQMLHNYSALYRELEIPQAAVNWSNHPTQFYEQAGSKLAARVGAAIGAGVGHTFAGALPYPGAAEAVGAGVGHTATSAMTAVHSAVSNARAVRQLRREMPIVINRAQQWRNAYAAAQRANTVQTVGALNAAAADLAAVTGMHQRDFVPP